MSHQKKVDRDKWSKEHCQLQWKSGAFFLYNLGFFSEGTFRDPIINVCKNIQFCEARILYFICKKTVLNIKQLYSKTPMG